MYKNLRRSFLVGLILSLLIIPQALGAQLAKGPIPKDTTLNKYTVDSTGEEYTIVTVVKGQAQWFDRMREGIKQFAKSSGQNSYMKVPSSFDAPVQNNMIKDLIAKGKADAIGVVPNSIPATDPVLKEAQKAGIVIIGHEGSTLDNVDFDIEGFNNAAYGAHWMDWLAEKMDHTGQYAAFVGHLTAKSHNEFIDAAIKRQKEKYPNMELVVKRQESEESSQVAYSKTKQLLRKYPHLKGIMSCSAIAAKGVARAISESNLEEETYTVGTSTVNTVGRKYISSGAFDMVTFWDPAFAGYAIQKLAIRVLEGWDVEEGTDLGIPGYHSLEKNGTVMEGSAWVDVTEENMDKYNF